MGTAADLEPTSGFEPETSPLPRKWSSSGAVCGPIRVGEDRDSGDSGLMDRFLR